MQTYGNQNVEYGWWSGNSRFTDFSAQFLAAHIGQIASMTFFAGSITLFELSRYNPDIPLYAQGFVCLPQLAREGFGIGSGGALVDTYPMFAVGMIHLFAAAVLGSGAIFHILTGPKVLAESDSAASQRFHFEWDDFETQGRILGHHLLFLGSGALLFVAWAATHGIYDPNVGEVRAVAPGFDIVRIFKYGWSTPGFNPFFVDNLEDVMGGHLFVALIDIAGGIYHILVKPWPYTERIYTKSGEALLGYALGGLGLMGLVAAYFCSVNDVVFPVEFFGPVLQPNLGFLPNFADTLDVSASGHTSRFWIANFHYFWGFYCIQGHLFHALRASGFDFRVLTKFFTTETVELGADV